jgi:hypothetical protein
MRELIATVHLTAFNRSDADAHVEGLTRELHLVRASVLPLLTLRGAESPVVLQPSWLRGELLELAPHRIEMVHTITERHQRFYCTTKIGVAGAPERISDDDEPQPDTIRACPSSRRH